MFEGGKLTFWDVGTYLTIGFFFSSLFIIYLISFFEVDFSYWLSLTKDFSTLLIILFPIVFLAIGMIIEPLANFSVKGAEKVCFLKPKKNKYINTLKTNSKKFIDKENLEDGVSIFNYCKAIVELNIQNSKYDIYLARFGFYRSLCFLTFCLFSLDWFIINFTISNFLINCVLLFISVVFLKRSQMFKIHMENCVYYNYLALMTRSQK